MATDCDVEGWEIGANVAMGVGRKISKVILAKISHCKIYHKVFMLSSVTSILL